MKRSSPVMQMRPVNTIHPAIEEARRKKAVQRMEMFLHGLETLIRCNMYLTAQSKYIIGEDKTLIF